MILMEVEMKLTKPKVFNILPLMYDSLHKLTEIIMVEKVKQ